MIDTHTRSMNHTLKVGKFHTFESIESSLLKELFRRRKLEAEKSKPSNKKDIFNSFIILSLPTLLFWMAGLRKLSTFQSSFLQSFFSVRLSVLKPRFHIEISKRKFQKCNCKEKRNKWGEKKFFLTEMMSVVWHLRHQIIENLPKMSLMSPLQSHTSFKFFSLAWNQKVFLEWEN